MQEKGRKMSDKKYYWLKLKEDFFEEDTISWLEEQKNGKEYVLFYLKLCLKSLKTNGLLIRNVGEMLIPYDLDKLSQLTHTNIDIVRVAMGLFQKIGLIQTLENGEIFISQLQNMVGSETKWAELKRGQRLQEALDNVQRLSANCPREIEIDKEIEIENRTIKCYEDEIGHLTPNNLTLLNSYKKDLSDDLICKAIKIARENGKPNMAYIKGILNNWISLGVKNINEIPEKPITKNKTKQQSLEFNDSYEGMNLEDLFDN